MNIRGKLVFAVTALSIVVGAHGAVVDSADVAGFTTFQDTVSGRVWLDMDNFFFLGANPEPLGPDLVDRSLYTGFEMIDAAQNAGFTFATRDDVSALLSTLPLTAGEWKLLRSYHGIRTRTGHYLGNVRRRQRQSIRHGVGL